MGTPSLLVKNLSKRFSISGPDVVASLDFEIQPGESVAFLGANGAGKSTTIKMLCGILRPSGGSALISGFAAGSPQANRILGLVFGTRSQLYLHMTVGQCFDLIAEIYYVTGAEKKTRIAELAALFQVEELLPRRVRTLSLGQRMRCEVIAALIHRPKILLADEPTIGLDVVAKNQLRELIRRWQVEERTTLLLTSHDLSDVEALCNRCLLIDGGVKRYDGLLRELKGDLSFIRRIQVTAASATRGALSSQQKLQLLPDTETYVHRYELSTREIPMTEGLALLSAHYGDDLQDIAISEVTLEEVLGRIYTGKRT